MKNIIQWAQVRAHARAQILKENQRITVRMGTAKGTTWGTVCEQQSAAIRTFAKIRAHGGHKYKERRRKRVYRYIFPAKERKYS